MIIVGKLWINMNLIFVLIDPTKSTSFRNINFFSHRYKKNTPNTIYLTLPANFLARNIKFNVHISIIIHIMIKIISFVFWKTGHFLLDRPLCYISIETQRKLLTETVHCSEALRNALSFKYLWNFDQFIGRTVATQQLEEFGKYLIRYLGQKLTKWEVVLTSTLVPLGYFQIF